MDDIQELRSQLKSDNIEQRATAAQKLSLAGIAAAECAVELVLACRDESKVREYAVAALEEMGPPSADLVDPLSKLVGDSNPLAAYWATTLLGRLETKAVASQVQLAVALTISKELSVRERAAWALGQIKASSTDAIAALTQATQAPEPRLARLATTALEQVKK